MKIHPTAIIDPCVEFLGSNIDIGPYCVIGLEGEIQGDRNKNGQVIIGDNTIIRAHVTIDRGSEGRSTIIGHDSYLMSKSHIGHDVITNKFLTLSTGAKIGGHCIIGRYVNIGLNAVIHQRLHIGHYVMIGMGTTVTKDIYHCSKVAGNPCRILGWNDRHKDKENYNELKRLFTTATDNYLKKLYRRKDEQYT